MSHDLKPDDGGHEVRSKQAHAIYFRPKPFVARSCILLVHQTVRPPYGPPIVQVCYCILLCCICKRLCKLRECCALPARAERSRQPPQASPFARVGQGERAKLFTACQRTLHACTAVIILALLQWLWRRGKTGRAIAALAELSELRKKRARAWSICTGSLDAGSL